MEKPSPRSLTGSVMEWGLKQHLAQSLVDQANKQICEPTAETHALSVSGCFRMTYAHAGSPMSLTPASPAPPHQACHLEVILKGY